MNEIPRKIISVALSGMLMLSALAVTAMPSTVSADLLPTSFYGNVTVDGVAALVNTIVTGEIVNAKGSPGNGTITTTEAGKYGGPGAWDPTLDVNTDSDDDLGKTIEFYVQLPSWGEAKQAAETAIVDGGKHKLDLTVGNVTVTVLEGHVSFTGRGTAPDDKWKEGFVVRFFQGGSEMAWSPINATTDNTGVFNITDLAPGTYDIGIKNWTCLSELKTNETLTAGNTTVVDFGTTREGDANNNDHINILDASFLAYSYGSSEGGARWNPHCDFDRDGSITMSDALLLKSNFGQHGDLA